nr:hypothetical protein [Pontibacter harenae]
MLLQNLTGQKLVHQYVWLILVFFIFITAFTFYLTNMGLKNDADNFQVYYFSSMGFRMVLSIGVIFAYVYFVGADNLRFVFNFFIFYFLFTGFEIYSLLGNLRPNLKEPK